MEIGVYTFAELGDAGPAARMRELLEEATLAEQVGLDVFGVGEHHRPDFVVSAPAVALAAVAALTSRIRLTSAVSVLSSDDPVRVFEEFASLDLLSNGRAEIMAGRGSFIESFPLFGYDLDDYDELFAEKLELLLALRSAERVTWSGRHRASLAGLGVYPRPVQEPLPGLGRRRWVARVGGPCRHARPADGARDHRRPARAIRALRRAAPACRGRSGPRAAPAAQHQLARLRGRDVAGGGRRVLPIVRGDDEPDREGTRAGPGLARQDFNALRTKRGALVVGSPDEVVEKILFQHELFGHQRFMAQMSVGSLPHAQVLRSLELFGTEVAPAVRAELARRAA